MRKVSYFAILIILYVAQIGCSTNWDEKFNEFPFETCANTSLSVSSDTLYFPSEASSRQLSISAESYWTAIPSANWIQLSESRAKGNSTLTISVSENKNAIEQRKGSVKINNGIETVTVYVEQGNLVEHLQLDKYELTFPHHGGSNQVIVNANVTWTAISNDSWISVTKNDAGTAVAVEIQRNAKIESRQGSFTIHGVEKTYTINVNQEAAPEELQPNSLELYFPYYGGSNQVLVNSNVNWSVSSESPWISVKKNDIGTAITVELQSNEYANSRKGTIIIKGVNLICTVSVTQAGASEQLQLNRTELSFPPHGGSDQVIVSANTDWSVSSDVTWISTEKNDINTAFAVIVEPNTTTESKNGIILVRGATKTSVVKVTQDPMIEQLVLNKTNLSFPSHGGSDQVIVSANTDWSVSSDVTWISTEKNDINTAFAVMVEPNNITESRNGIILVSGAAKTYIVKVTQEPMIEQIVLDKTNLSFPYHGGSNQVIVNANVNWTVNCNASWIRVEKNKANTAFAIYAQSNESVNDRSTTITVTGVKKSYDISVLQKGKR